MRFALVSGAVTLLACLGACGGSANGSASGSTVSQRTTALTPSASPTISIAEYQQQYLVIVGPYNAALDAFNAHLKPYANSYPSETDLQSWCTPFAAALTAFNDQLLRAPWPANAMSDVHSLANADAPELADLNACGSPNEVTWFNQFNKDNESASTAANVLRADLGLPPPPSSTP